MSLRLPALLAGLVAVGCAPASESPGQPAGWDEGIRLSVAKNVSAIVGVVELDLEAHVELVSIVLGGPTPMWTYNGLLPGPMIRRAHGC